MRHLILIIIMVFLAGCSVMTPTATLLTGQNSEFEEDNIIYTGRLGLNIDKTEFGLDSKWMDNTNDNQQFYGIYIQQDLLQDPNAIILGNWYLGGSVSLDFDGDGGLYGPYIGTKSYLGGIEILTELQYLHYNKALSALNEQSEEKWRISIGPRFKLPASIRP